MNTRTMVVVMMAIVARAASVSAQPWSAILDASRAIDWGASVSSAEVTSYSTPCTTQPTLQAGEANAAANTGALVSALASCDATHNVINIASGTFYLTALSFGTQGQQVIRGAGANATTLVLTSTVACGLSAGICMKSSGAIYNGNPAALPPSGTQQCLWTAGHSKGTTTITLSDCGGAPPLNKLIVLDQANDTSDTSGVYICDSSTADCSYESPGNYNGRRIGGVTHSQQQVTYTSAVESLGGGAYSVTISPGVYFSNVRDSQAPGAWWSNTVSALGVEDVTLDGTALATGTANVAMYDCRQCWMKNVRSLNGGRAHLFLYQSAHGVIRDNYFYGAKGGGAQSYAVEFETSSAFLVENNIFQQVTAPLMFGQGAGNVIAYNFSINNVYTAAPTYASASYSGHNAGNSMNLFEGNNFLGIWADNAWGASAQTTYFRNMLPGWQSGKSQATMPIIMRAKNRVFNVIGNVMGQPSYHTQYQSYALSTSAGSGAVDEELSVYSMGWSATGPMCSTGGATTCDPVTFSSLMRWGNWDVVTNATKWDTTEASPSAVPYVSANFTSTYFGSLAQSLPASLYSASSPEWWPSGKPWPAIGPGVVGGTLGTCSGTYAGAQALATRQCTGGTLTSAYAGLAFAIPAQDCYLRVMAGPPDGTGDVLAFDAAACYATTPTAPTSVSVIGGTPAVTPAVCWNHTGPTSFTLSVGTATSDIGLPTNASCTASGLTYGLAFTDAPLATLASGQHVLTISACSGVPCASAHAIVVVKM